MRNGKHYVQVRMTKAEKENFLRLSKLCNAPEKTVLYWLVNDMIVYEKPPETFFKISNLMRRLETNVDHIWLGRSNLSEAITAAMASGTIFAIRYQFEAGRTYTAVYTYMINPSYEETYKFTKNTTVTLVVSLSRLHLTPTYACQNS